MRFLSTVILGMVFSVGAQPACSPWTDSHTAVLEIGPTDNIVTTVQQAASGTTILLKPGTYKVAATLQFIKDNVTMRSKTGIRGDVILDGNGGGLPLNPANFLGEIIAVAASNITLADFSIRYAKFHGIHAYAPTTRNITQLRMRNMRVFDCSQQQIKINSSGGSPLYWVDEGILECSLVEYVDKTLMQRQSNYFYTGGIDVHGGWNWIIRNNQFRGFYRNDSLLEAAVHFWNKSRGTLVENNLFVDNYRGITFGTNTSHSTTERKYPDSAGNTPYLDHIDGIIRNNMIFNRKGVHLESGMELTNVAVIEVYHNTIFAMDPPFSGIEYRFPDTKVLIANNMSSLNIMQRDGAQGTLQGNLVNVPANLFVNAAAGDLHLGVGAVTAIDKGNVLAVGKATLDFDGQTRDLKPDIGADEYSTNTGLLGPHHKSGTKHSSSWRMLRRHIPMLINEKDVGGAPPFFFTPTGRKD